MIEEYEGWACPVQLPAAVATRNPGGASMSHSAARGPAPAGGSRGGAGSQIVTFVPRPGALSMSIVPPWASTIFREVGSPRPLPPCFVV